MEIKEKTYFLLGITVATHQVIWSIDKESC